jgi:hypothetical protein
MGVLKEKLPCLCLSPLAFRSKHLVVSAVMREKEEIRRTCTKTSCCLEGGAILLCSSSNASHEHHDYSTG